MSEKNVALIVGGGPGISASCARLFSAEGMKVAVAARNPDKSALKVLEEEHAVRLYQCDATEPAAVATLFDSVAEDLGSPNLVVHNIGGEGGDIVAGQRGGAGKLGSGQLHPVARITRKADDDRRQLLDGNLPPCARALFGHSF